MDDGEDGGGLKRVEESGGFGGLQSNKMHYKRERERERELSE